MLFLSEAERRSALELARHAIEQGVSHQRLPEIIPSTGIFACRGGVFVTLHTHGKLRGCIGVIEAEESLGEAIVRCAASAALHDPRFPALRAEELTSLSIEISILSPLSPISPEAIEIGRHGLLISTGSQRGLLLPQVAVEHQLTREKFLEETCKKAGLNREAWRDPEIEIFGFVCEVFSDQRHAAAS
jgi:AmmeMemoRadiSam system protein A